MKILVTKKQLKYIHESELKERLGVPEGILETSKDLFYDILNEMKKLNSIEELKNSFLINGKYKVGDHVFEKIFVNFDFMEDERYTPEVAGAANMFKQELDDKNYRILKKIDGTEELHLLFRFYIKPSTTVPEIINLLEKDSIETISFFTHEIGHGYEGTKRRVEKLKDRVVYNVSSGNRFANIEPLNKFLYYSYYVHSVENVVRPSELAQLLKLHNVSKNQFINFFQKTEMYQMLKEIQNFSIDELKKKLLYDIEDIKSLFDHNNLDYESFSDDEIVEKCMELFYINLVNWKGGFMKQFLTTNFMEQLVGFVGGKAKFFEEYLKYLHKFRGNTELFFTTEIKNLNIQSTKMIKKLSKLYDLLSND